MARQHIQLPGEPEAVSVDELVLAVVRSHPRTLWRATRVAKASGLDIIETIPSLVRLAVAGRIERVGPARYRCHVQ